MISKSISISEKVNIRLPDIFDMVLYTWLIPHSDDFGRLYGSPAKIKALVVPMLDKSIKEVEISLQHIHDSELINWYEVDGDKYIQINNFEDHQTGLHKRTISKFPEPLQDIPGSSGKIQEIPLEGKGRELKGTEENRTEEEGNRRELDIDQQKNKILQLLNQNEVKDIMPYPLEQLESYVGAVDFEVIETAIKKSYKKHINYALKTLKGMIKDGIKTKEQLTKGGSQVETQSGRSDPSSKHTATDQRAENKQTANGRDAPRDEGNVVPIHGKSLTDMFARQG